MSHNSFASSSGVHDPLPTLGCNTCFQCWRHWTLVRPGNLSAIFFQFLPWCNSTASRKRSSSSLDHGADCGKQLGDLPLCTIGDAAISNGPWNVFAAAPWTGIVVVSAGLCNVPLLFASHISARGPARRNRACDALLYNCAVCTWAKCPFASVIKHAATC